MNALRASMRLYALLSLVRLGCHGYSSGAPSLACTSMNPQHYANPQAGAAPYTISTSASTYDTDGTITVTVTGTFKGIFLQARQAGTTTIVGSWGSPPTGTRLMTCQSKSNSAVTHANNGDKTDLSFQWTAPSDGVGDIEFVATIVQVRTTFWIGVKSSSLSQLTTTTSTTTASTTTTPTPSPSQQSSTETTAGSSSVTAVGSSSSTSSSSTTTTSSSNTATSTVGVTPTASSSASPTTTMRSGHSSAMPLFKQVSSHFWVFVTLAFLAELIDVFLRI